MPTARRPRLILTALASCGVLMAVTQTIVIPLLPRLPALTGGTPTDVSWLLTVTLLTGAVFTPLLGRAGDMYGKRRVLLLALGSMTIGSVLCAVSSSLTVLIVGRGLQGTALAVVPLGVSMLRDELPRERVVAAIAMMSATLGIGAAFGIPLATLVVEHADWHTLFWLCVVLGVVALTAVVLVVPESPIRTNGRFDLVGALGLSAFLGCLLVPVSKGSAWGWGSPTTLGFLAAAVLILPLWTVHQLRARTPMVDLRVSARPAVLFTNLAALLVGFSFYANTLATAQLVQEPVSTGYGLGASIVVSGLCLLPSGFAMMLLSPVSARVSAARGPRFTLLVATGVMATGYAVRLFTSESLIAIVIGATVVAAGTAMAYSALPALIMHAVPVTETAAANGLNTLMRSIGQAMCSAVVATVLASLVTVHGPTLSAYLTVFVVAGASALVALGLTLLIPAPRPAQVEDRVLVGAAA
ncbi:MFS transporter [Allokutzneria sp. A3M-2-11 16]|uniref:MFS transporter n=1 Tax=Allokutzneria sp. A3M-2-11 16 TaxID=2962043 RepID=UPI0020B85EC0|nr:MFS transporter [Allokutzneria sp. A3M-2-11 16]MCP3803807.1 MFS transporter [Allokutzneria sp. A3M-2-11 16]